MNSSHKKSILQLFFIIFLFSITASSVQADNLIPDYVIFGLYGGIFIVILLLNIIPFILLKYFKDKFINLKTWYILPFDLIISILYVVIMNIFLGAVSDTFNLLIAVIYAFFLIIISIIIKIISKDGLPIKKILLHGLIICGLFIIIGYIVSIVRTKLY